MMQKTIALTIMLGFGVAAMGCGAVPSPLSPDPSAVTSTDAQGTATAVTASGTIRSLDVQARTSSLSAASGVSRIVRADETTQTWIRGAQARFGSLQNGMTVAIRGPDQRRFVLAQSIVSM